MYCKYVSFQSSIGLFLENIFNKEEKTFVVDKRTKVKMDSKEKIPVMTSKTLFVSYYRVYENNRRRLSLQN